MPFEECDTNATVCCRQWTSRLDMKDGRTLNRAPANLSRCVEANVSYHKRRGLFRVCLRVVRSLASDVTFWQCLSVRWSALGKLAPSIVTARKAVMQVRWTCNNLQDSQPEKHGPILWCYFVDMSSLNSRAPTQNSSHVILGSLHGAWLDVA